MARLLVRSLYLSQPAFLKFHQGIGALLVKEISGIVQINKGWCWEWGNCSRTSLVGMIPCICVEKVTSGFVLEFHLADWNEAGCFGS